MANAAQTRHHEGGEDIRVKELRYLLSEIRRDPRGIPLVVNENNEVELPIILTHTDETVRIIFTANDHDKPVDKADTTITTPTTILTTSTPEEPPSTPPDDRESVVHDDSAPEDPKTSPTPPTDESTKSTEDGVTIVSRISTGIAGFLVFSMILVPAVATISTILYIKICRKGKRVCEPDPENPEDPEDQPMTRAYLFQVDMPPTSYGDSSFVVSGMARIDPTCLD
jgi:hypothetical protein